MGVFGVVQEVRDHGLSYFDIPPSSTLWRISSAQPETIAERLQERMLFKQHFHALLTKSDKDV
jgi:hypothetical protein